MKWRRDSAIAPIDPGVPVDPAHDSAMSAGWQIGVTLVGFVGLPAPRRFAQIARPVIVGRVTVGELAEHYLDRCPTERLGAESKRTYGVGLRAASRVVIEGISVTEHDVHAVTSGWAQRVHDAIRERSGGATADKFTKLMSAAHRFAANRGADLPPNPWGSLERYGSPAPEIDFPAGWLLDALDVIEQAKEGALRHPRKKRHVAGLPGHVADFYTLCLCTGARPWCEILKLRWADIDERAGTITFAFSKRKKGERRRIRKLPLEVLCTRGREALERQRSSSEWVWPGQDPSTHCGDTRFAEWWVPFREYAATLIPFVDVEGAPLCLYEAGRHAFASHLHELGFPEHTISEFLGHRDSRVTARYIHKGTRHLVAPARMLAASLERGKVEAAAIERPGLVLERLRRAIDWLERRAKAEALAGGSSAITVVNEKTGSPFSEAAIKSWKLGKREPSLSALHQIAIQLGVSLGWFVGEGPDDQLPELQLQLRMVES